MTDLRKIVITPLQKRAEHLLKQTKTMFEKTNVENPTLVARRFLAELDGIALHELSVFNWLKISRFESFAFF